MHDDLSCRQDRIITEGNFNCMFWHYTVLKSFYVNELEPQLFLMYTCTWACEV